MKKLLFVLALVAVYGLSVSVAKAGKPVSGKSVVTVVADNKIPDDKKVDSQNTDVKKESTCTGKKIESTCAGKSESAGCCSKAKSAGCAESKACCSKKEPAEVVPAKK